MMPSTQPTEDNHFKGRYAIWIGVGFLLLGLVSTGLNLWVMLLSGEFSGAIVLGVLLTVIGVLYLKQPYFAIAPNRLTIYNLLGKSVKRYPFISYGHITVENGHVYIKSEYTEETSSREKVNISRWLVRPEDWARLTSMQGE